MSNKFDLPAVTIAASVDDALQLMRTADRSAVVVKDGRSFGIVRNTDIVNLKRRQEKSGADFSIGVAAGKALKVTELPSFRKTRVNFRVVDDRGGTVTIESRHELYRDKIIVTRRVCFCSNCQHSCPEPHCRDGGTCSSCRAAEVQCY